MTKNIGVLPGDGIGPEVVAEAIKVMDAIAEKFGHQFNYSYADVGAIAIDKTGDPLPPKTLEVCMNADAFLFGAIGHPRFDNDPSAKVRPEQGLLRLRKELGLFANIRPVVAYDALLDLSPLKRERIQGVDLVIYRELTGGIYFGEKGRLNDGQSAFDTCMYHAHEIHRIVRLAFEAAAKRRKKVTLIDKANVLENSRLWREHFQEIAKEYPNIETDYLFVDNAAMQMILWPKQFDVVVTGNMFGDIISDESSVIAGSLGLLPSASIGEKTGMFEPIHGSYPQATGLNIANPMATILSAAMLLEHLELLEEATAIRSAVDQALEEGYVTQDLNKETYYSTSEVGDWIVGRI